MIGMQAEFCVSQQRRAEVLGLLRPLVDPTRYMTGCVDACLSAEPNVDPICFSTEWRSRDQLERHIRSEAFLNILVAMDLCDSPPVVLVSEIGEGDGMAYIASVRGAGNASSSSVAEGPAPRQQSIDSDGVRAL